MVNSYWVWECFQTQNFVRRESSNAATHNLRLENFLNIRFNETREMRALSLVARKPSASPYSIVIIEKFLAKNVFFENGLRQFVGLNTQLG